MGARGGRLSFHLVQLLISCPSYNTSLLYIQAVLSGLSAFKVEYMSSGDSAGEKLEGEDFIKRHLCVILQRVLFQLYSGLHFYFSILNYVFCSTTSGKHHEHKMLPRLMGPYSILVSENMARLSLLGFFEVLPSCTHLPGSTEIYSLK